MWCKVKEKKPKDSGQLWALLIRGVKVHSMKKVCEILFLTLSIARTLQAQTCPHQTDCIPKVMRSSPKSWGACDASLLLHYSWVGNWCLQVPGRLGLEVAHRPEDDGKAAKEHLWHLLDLHTAGMSSSCARQRCVFLKTSFFRLSWEFHHFSVADY